MRDTIHMRWSILLIAMAVSLRAESGSFTIHMILHAIGEERYEIAADGGALTLNSTFEYSDRGMKRSTAVTLRMKSDYTPESLDVKGSPVRTVTVTGGTAAMQEDGTQRSAKTPARYFTIFGPSPFAIQMAMMRYWLAHGKPAELPVLRASADGRSHSHRGGGARFHHGGWQGGDARPLHRGESDVRPRSAVDEPRRATGGGDDLRGRIADGGGAQRV